MRVLESPARPGPCWWNPLRRIRKRGFEIALGLCLAGYGVLLALHPAADRESRYPEPVENLLYRANFPNHRGAPAWALEIRRTDAEASCGDIGGAYYREVAGERCHALLRSWDAKALLSGVTKERCRYHYAGLAEARSGTDVSYVAMAGRCVARNSDMGSYSTQLTGSP